MLPFTMEQLNDAVRDGRVTARRHPLFDYTIYNYSAEVQYSNQWDSVTLACRGLILDDAGTIVARPWEKFFNLGQVDLPIQFDTPVEVMDKADGSLGIMYPAPDGKNWIATRGSFESEQAYQGCEILWADYPEIARMDADYNDIYTFLFEIIYPANRIVLDYGDTRDLILLGAVQNENGYYCGPQYAKAMLNWTGPVVETMPHKTISEALGAMDRKNAEGYVIRSHNFMVKCKQPDYLELHKLVTNATPKTVWEQLRNGKSRSEIVSVFPDEFHDYIGSMIDPLVEQYMTRLDEIVDGFNAAMDKVDPETAGEPTSRKDYAEEFKKHKDARYFFLLLDNRGIRDVLWTELKPKEAK